MNRSFFLLVFSILMIVFSVFVLISCRHENKSDIKNSPESIGGVPVSRLNHLKHGINIAYWFWTYPVNQSESNMYPFTLENTLDRITEKELKLIKKIGFDHIRIPIDFTRLYDPERPGALRSDTLTSLKKVIALCEKIDTAVIIDIHRIALEKELSTYSKGLESGDISREVFVEFWETLAENLSDTSEELVFFEILNEPSFVSRSEEWYQIQKETVNKIRSVSPGHTILVCSAVFNNYKSLNRMKPYKEQNLIYNFHFYEPIVFTHQGAYWIDFPINMINSLPYPADPAIMQSVINNENNPMLQGLYMNYAYEFWDGLRLENEVLSISRWAKKNCVPLICTEFGVYKKVSPRESRLKWYKDLRTALENCGIGWTVWEFDCPEFGVVSYENGKYIKDKEILKALGL